MAENFYYGTGRRKSAVARVFMKRGSGNIVVNGKPIDEFFTRVTGRMIVRQPLELVQQSTGFDIMVNNAGVALVGPISEVTPQELQRIWSINVDGVLWGIQAAGTRFPPRHATCKRTLRLGRGCKASRSTFRPPSSR